MKTEKLVHDFFDEIKLNQQYSGKKTEIDFNLISRFLDNNLSENDIIRVKQFKKENPELAELLQPIEEPKEKQNFVVPTKTGKIFRIADLLKVAACLVLIVSTAFFVAKINKKESVKKEHSYVFRGINRPVKTMVTNELENITNANSQLSKKTK